MDGPQQLGQMLTQSKDLSHRLVDAKSATLFLLFLTNISLALGKADALHSPWSIWQK